MAHDIQLDPGMGASDLGGSDARYFHLQGLLLRGVQAATPVREVDCVFCALEAAAGVLAGERACHLHAMPIVSDGHSLVSPRRHVATPWSCTSRE